jgi:5-methylcytosine-specific restriction endonuclease McrA
MSQNASGKADGSTDTETKDSSVCPTCGQECKSKKGMRQHHTRTHGESIAKVELECDGCGQSITRWKSQLDRAEKRYCSSECYHANYDQPTGKDAHTWNRKEVECDYCGKPVTRRLSRVKRSENLYCSRECADNDHSDRMSGESNPRWLGGVVDYYGPNWKEQRKKTLDRDNYTCQYCGATRSDGILSVHHIQKLRYFKQQYDTPKWWKRANKLSNLVTLCRVCHGQWEGIPLKPQR